MKKQYTIKVTVLLENSFWVGLFSQNQLLRILFNEYRAKNFKRIFDSIRAFK
jgi:hypothetical protein